MLTKIEIETRVAASTLGKSATIESHDVIQCCLGDDLFRKNISKERMAQPLHQLNALQLNFALYVAAAETEKMYVVIIKCPTSVRQRGFQVLKEVVTQLFHRPMKGKLCFHPMLSKIVKRLCRPEFSFGRLLKDKYNSKVRFNR